VSGLGSGSLRPCGSVHQTGDAQMRPSGTEPGDFVEFDFDLIEAERRQRLRDALNQARPTLERETGVQLQLSNDGNDLVLTADGNIRFRASLAPDGRVIVTDLGSGDLL